MPEGDTVYRAARAMNTALRGKRLKKTDFRVPSIATADLSGSSVIEVISRGKHMLTRIDNGLTLHTHFKMDGTWHIYRPGQRWRGGKPHEVRIVLETDDRVAVGFRIPVIELLPTADEHKVVGHLGPDILSEQWNLAVAAKNISASETSIFEALHDQRNLAGLGNIYCNETLFRAGVNPWTPAKSVQNVPALLEIAHKLMTANVNGWHQSTTGDTRAGAKHWVFERSGRPCRRCGTQVRSAVHSDLAEARLTYWCPSCQSMKG